MLEENRQNCSVFCDASGKAYLATIYLAPPQDGKEIVSFNYKFFFKSCAKEGTFNSPFRTIASVNWSNKFATGEEAIIDPNHRLLPVVRFYVCFLMDQRSNSKSSICKQHSQRDHGIKGCFIQIYQQKGKFQSIFQQEVNKQKIYNCGAWSTMVVRR